MGLSAIVPIKAQSMGLLSFFFVNQAMDVLSERAINSIQITGKKSLPSFEVSAGTASLINDKLPLETDDGFVLLVARSPAPGAIEVIVTAPKNNKISEKEMDESWGPGIVKMFCGPSDSLWKRWLLIGGSAGLTVNDASGHLIRQYGATWQDCKSLGF